MRLPDREDILEQLIERLQLPAADPNAGRQLAGKVVEIGPTLLKASLPGVSLAEICRLEPSGINAEVVAINGDYAMLSPFAEPLGVTTGSRVVPTGSVHQIALGDFLWAVFLTAWVSRSTGFRCQKAVNYAPSKARHRTP